MLTLDVTTGIHLSHLIQLGILDECIRFHFLRCYEVEYLQRCLLYWYYITISAYQLQHAAFSEVCSFISLASISQLPQFSLRFL